MQPEWVEIFPLKHFFQLKISFQTTPSPFVNARTVLVTPWAFLVFFLKIPCFRDYNFWQV